MPSVIWTVFVGLFLAAAIADARRYKIPNWISVALVVLFVVAAVTGNVPVTGYWPHLALGVGVLLVGYLLYLFTGMGAGDAKLAAATVLWAGLPGLYVWATVLALAMAVLALGLVVARRIAMATLGPAPRLRVLQRGAPVPLGVALAVAAVVASGDFASALWSF